MFVFLGQWCMTLLSHPADCLLGLHAYTWTTMIPSATQSTFTALQWLSNNNTTQCLTHTRAHTHMLTPVCHRPNQFHQCSLAQMFLELKWQDPQRRSNKCLLTLLLSSFHFISFGVPTALHAIMEVTNYSPCNFIVQCTNKQHSPPFITWNRIFKTQLNVGRELSKAKPDVVRRVFVQAKPWGMLSSGEFVRECVCACVWWGEGVRRSRSSLLGWDNTKSNCSREVVRQAGRGSLQPGWRQGQQSVCVVGVGAETGAVGVRLVIQQGALLCCQTHSQSTWSLSTSLASHSKTCTAANQIKNETEK